MEKARIFLSKLPPALLSLFTLVVILWLTLAPDPLGQNSPKLFSGADKIVHGVMFGFLASMFMLDWQRRHLWTSMSLPMAIVAATVSSSIGIAIEYAQQFMKLGRGLEFADMIADTFGAVIFTTLYLRFQRVWISR